MDSIEGLSYALTIQLTIKCLVSSRGRWSWIFNYCFSERKLFVIYDREVCKVQLWTLFAMIYLNRMQGFPPIVPI
ncbi:hypothetical protein XELAEV_18009116mg [Xenopus laevis]|uniref:Uncharacterized protein n=1 Tax=Xenopus laevis TaxID=8355 RepID=A0A974DS06_XENLA|nr:hypothetical protein XELAEV_18009116mg [Xenopus laevis]